MDSEKTQIPQLLEYAVSSSDLNRNELAKDIMKIFLNNQGRHRRMTFINRIKFYLGRYDYKAEYDYNFNDIAKKSFEMADAMIGAV